MAGGTGQAPTCEHRREKPQPGPARSEAGKALNTVCLRPLQELPGGPVPDSGRPMQRAWVQFLLIGARSHILQPRVHMQQLNISCAITKTWYRLNKLILKKKKKKKNTGVFAPANVTLPQIPLLRHFLWGKSMFLDKTQFLLDRQCIIRKVIVTSN